MSKAFLLFKHQIKSRYGLHGIRYSWKYDRDNFINRLLISSAVIFFLCFTMYGYTETNRYIYKQLFVVGKQDMMIQILLNLAIVAIFTIGLPGIFISLAINQNEINYIVSFPLKSWQILFTNFLGVYLLETAIAVFLLVPGFIIYGLNTQEGLKYYISVLFIILLLSVIPITIQMLVIILIQRLGYFINNRSLSNAAAFIVNICIISFIGLQNRYSNFTANTKIKALNLKLFEIYYPEVLAYKAIVVRGLYSFGYLIIFIFISILFFVLLIYLMSDTYICNITKNSEIISKTKKVNLTKLLPKSKFGSLLYYDIKQFYDNSTFVMYGIVTTLFIPVILLYTTHSEMFLAFIKGHAPSPVVIITIAFIYMLIGGSNKVAATSISREGKNFIYLKSLPIESKDIIKVKLTHCNILSIIIGLFIAIISYILTHVEIFYILIAFLIGFFVLNIYFIFSIFLELSYPVLQWENPKYAMRSSINFAISYIMLILFLVLGIGFIIPRLSMLNTLYFIRYSLMTICILIVLNFILYRALTSYGNKMYYEIEI
ncbi:hypothetical protein PQ689_06550 [Thermoanaerobacterium thermosaccharolyticum]|uniref:hypothetical protein n=1 Tax=Thermoanaerobacterium thermosaccharolyticum TaxID=1517 RepID=UPI002FD8D416